MGNLKIRYLGWLLIGAIALAAVGIVAGSQVIDNSARGSGLAWRAFQDANDARARAIDALVMNIGYGGMIHPFKNFVLRKDIQRLPKIQDAAGASNAALEQYAATKIGEEEREALAAIREVITAYANNALLVKGMVITEAADG